MSDLQRVWSVWLVVLVLLFLPACFEKPIVERVALEFLPDGSLAIDVGIELSEAENLKKNPAVRGRLTEMRDATLRGDDEWSRSIAALDPEREVILYEFHEGSLVEALRRVNVDDQEKVEEFFSFTPVSAFLEEDKGFFTLEFIPNGTKRASAKQERKVRETFDRFSNSVAEYLEATADLYRYLQDAPDRAGACFGALFGSDDKEVTEQESDLLAPVEDAIGRLTEILVVEKNDAYSLDELSQLVFDPFPASLEIAIPGTPEEVVGFRNVEENRYAAPGLSLFGALETLGRNWIEPNLVLIYVEAARSDDDSLFSVEDLAARPRHVFDLPPASEVREAIEGSLSPLDIYRLSWYQPGL